ncbi:hypothetical protein GO621_09470 [Mucilaginibacter sp. HMF7410]|uniref:Uncharacterized protein n=1 Tax=Mucilaginibacter arboris TaxID=2682090 RepID=A0A7K1SWR6_9SPHI|nr:hypothetical protein [Mucilaginibacter arboris]MVN21765.1 hypothetical protein [Mucilaginibacter arboris]
MKANHNTFNNAIMNRSVGLNISNSKNESKSQHYSDLSDSALGWVKYQ